MDDFLWSLARMVFWVVIFHTVGYFMFFPGDLLRLLRYFGKRK